MSDERGLMRRRHRHWPISPFRELDRFFDEDWDQNVDFIPPVDIYQDENSVIAEMPIPKIDPEKIDVNIENDVLTISGNTEDKEEVKRENYYRKEVREGNFSRSVRLPMSVKAEESEAESKDGMLKIIMPKAEKTKQKKISVNVK